MASRPLRTMTTLSVFLVFGTLAADETFDFTAHEKTEIFIQHIVKFMKLDPAQYQAMVIEYEVAVALEEISSIMKSAPSGQNSLRSNFIRNALQEIRPDYSKALEHFEAKRNEAAIQAAEPLLQDVNPYVVAHARLLRAELDFRAEKYEKVIERCEIIAHKERLHLADDYRACELIAQSFNKLEKPILELAQYLILLVDYEELPPDVQRQAKSRLAALKNVAGEPLHTVAGWMNQVEKFLGREITSTKPTQVKERAIVSALDKLIELQEARERNTCKSCGGNCKGGACKNGGNPKGTRSRSPALVSKLPPPGKGEYNLRGVSRADASSRWGQLMEKEASRTLQSFSGKLPPRFQKLLEQYYREVSQNEEAN